jgi:hypothetical protein
MSCLSHCWLPLLFFLSLLSLAINSYGSDRLGISLQTFQQSLGKGREPLTFSPRPGSTSGTQEARLPENAGVVQAGGDPGNLTAVVLWLPLDQQGKLAGSKAKTYLSEFIKPFVSDSEPLVLWVDTVLARARTNSRSERYLESQLTGGYQLKAVYDPTLPSPMVSITVTATGDD